MIKTILSLLTATALTASTAMASVTLILTALLSITALSNLVPIAAAQDTAPVDPVTSREKPETDALQPQSSQAATAPSQAAPSQKDLGKQQVKEEEKQRVLGTLPNFETADRQTAVPLTTGQKFHLALRSVIDPFQFALAGLDSGLSQAQNDFPAYGRGAPGYAKRFAAAFTDQFSGTMFGNAIYPSLLHQEPRYLRRGSGTFKRRLFYSLAATFWTKNDNGTWGPNYSNVLGNFTSGGLANIYYPASSRGFGLTVQRTTTGTIEGAWGGILKEFWPDISAKLFHRKTP